MIVASAVLAASLAAGPTFTPHQPVDHRPCVSTREFNGYTTEQPKRDLEARWEVTGLGRQTEVPGYGRTTVYRRCGYPMRKAWYGVQYRLEDGRLWGSAVVWWRAPAPEAPTPAPAPVPAGPPQVISGVPAGE